MIELYTVYSHAWPKAIMIAKAEATWTPATPTPESNIEASHRHGGMPPAMGGICLDAEQVVGAQFIAR